MNLTLNVTINDDTIPIIDPLRAFFIPGLVGLYDCMSNQDLSGNGNHLTLGPLNTIGAAGIALSPNAPIATPLKEFQDMTVIACFNVADSADNKMLFGNMGPAALPFTGSRWSAGPASQTPQAIGADTANSTGAAPGYTHLNASMIGAWTVQAKRWSATTSAHTSHSGSTVGIEYVGGRAMSTENIWINGSPADVAAIQLKKGFTGTLGFLAYYNLVMDVPVAVSLMDQVQLILGTRGVPVP